MRRIALLALAAAAVSAAAAVAAQARSDATTLVVYSGRDERFVKPILDRFTARTGIRLQVRYGDSAALAATLLEEGRRSPADVFVAQDAGALGAVASRGQLRVLPESVLRRVPARFRAPGKRWVGVSGRARVVAYNTETVQRGELPTSIWGNTHARWKGKLGLPPTTRPSRRSSARCGSAPATTARATGCSRSGPTTSGSTPATPASSPRSPPARSRSAS